MTKVRIYFEGSNKLRPGFSQFFEKVVGRGKVNCVSCGGREQAKTDFDKAWGQRKPGEQVLLLIDSEFHTTLFDLLKLNNASRDCVYWMVELMESWFLGDPEALAQCYPKLDRTALEDFPDVEGIPKARVQSILKDATRDSGRRYERRTGAKTTVAPKILAALDPAKVRNKAKHCDLLLTRLEKECHGR